MTLSDGPSGVRGEVWDERDPRSTCRPATALASSWDPDLAFATARPRLEARRKGVDVVLGPTINLHRSPLGGRHFECFSEDPGSPPSSPRPTSSGVQDNGVGATPKHYVANDSETDRFTVDVRVDERALRELYLLPFEGDRRGRRLAGDERLQLGQRRHRDRERPARDPLNSEWGFDGVVVSDWTAVRSLDSARPRRTWSCPARRPWARAGRGGPRRSIDEADRPEGAAHPAARRAGRRARGQSTAVTPAARSTASRSPARPPSRARCCVEQRRRAAAGTPPRCEGRRDRQQRPRRPHAGRRQRDRAARARRLAARGDARGAARRRGDLLARRGRAGGRGRTAARPA